jgi:hypothetical protein
LMQTKANPRGPTRSGAGYFLPGVWEPTVIIRLDRMIQDAC